MLEVAWTPHLLNDRETRLRERIDFITDEKEAALAALWETREKLEKVRKLNHDKSRKIKELRASRNMWKERAQAKHGSFGRLTGGRCEA